MPQMSRTELSVKDWCIPMCDKQQKIFKDFCGIIELKWVNFLYRGTKKAFDILFVPFKCFLSFLFTQLISINCYKFGFLFSFFVIFKKTTPRKKVCQFFHLFPKYSKLWRYIYVCEV